MKRIALAVTALIAMPTLAATTTSNMAVSATVAGVCSIDATGAMAFDAYDGRGTSAKDAQADIGVTCTVGTSYTIALNNGQNAASASLTTRTMKSGPNYLDYELYSDASRGTVFTTSAPKTGTGSSVATRVYGRIPAGQAPFAGSADLPASYTDTVLVTVTF